jgi:hypothetical protein
MQYEWKIRRIGTLYLFMVDTQWIAMEVFFAMAGGISPLSGLSSERYSPNS